MLKLASCRSFDGPFVSRVSWVLGRSFPLCRSLREIYFFALTTFGWVGSAAAVAAPSTAPALTRICLTSGSAVTDAILALSGIPAHAVCLSRPDIAATHAHLATPVWAYIDQ